MQHQTPTKSHDGGMIPPIDYPPVDTGDDGKGFQRDGRYVVLALEIAALRLGVSFDSLLNTSKASRALAMAELGQFDSAITLIDNMRVPDLRAFSDEV